MPPTIKERLKIIAIEANKSSSVDSQKPVHLNRAPVNIKTTRKNRNESFLESIIASTSRRDDDLTHQPDNFTTTTITNNAVGTNNVQRPVLVAPKRDLTVPPITPISPSTQDKMPVNSIRSSMDTFTSSKDTSMPPPRPSAQKVTAITAEHSRTAMLNKMEKPGVAFARNQSNKEVFDYQHNSIVPKKTLHTTSNKLQHAKSNHSPFLEADSAYKSLLKWRPNWLEVI